MSNEMIQQRRRFLGTAAMTVALAQLAMFGCSESKAVDSTDAVPAKPMGNASFASMKQIDAGVLNVGYAEAGPSDGPAVILLHGWPYDIYSFVDVAPLLA